MRILSLLLAVLQIWTPTDIPEFKGEALERYVLQGGKDIEKILAEYDKQHIFFSTFRYIHGRLKETKGYERRCILRIMKAMLDYMKRYRGNILAQKTWERIHGIKSMMTAENYEMYRLISLIIKVKYDGWKGNLERTLMFSKHLQDYDISHTLMKTDSHFFIQTHFYMIDLCSPHQEYEDVLEYMDDEAHYIGEREVDSEERSALIDTIIDRHKILSHCKECGRALEIKRELCGMCIIKEMMGGFELPDIFKIAIEEDCETVKYMKRLEKNP